MISINRHSCINNHRKPFTEAKFESALFKGISNNDLVDITYNKLFITKRHQGFTGSAESNLITNLTNKLNENNAPEAIRKGLPLLVNTLCNAVNEFEQTNELDFSKGIKATNRLEQALHNKDIEMLNSYLLNIDNESLDRARNLPTDEAIEGVMMQIKFSNDYKTKTPPEELSKAFNTFYCRKLLKDNSVGLLNHYKNIDILKPYKKELDDISKQLDKKILYLGLSPKVKEIVDKASTNLGVRLEIYDSERLAKLIYNRLEYFKNIGRTVTDILDVIDFDESYGTGVYSKFCRQNLSDSSIKYCTNNDLIDKQHIRLSPWDILKMMNTGEEEKVSSLLTHEHGHLWHNEKIGDDVFYNLDKQLSFIDILEPEEKNIFNSYKNMAIEVIPGIENTFNNIGTVVSNFTQICNDERFKIIANEKLTDEKLKKLTTIINHYKEVINLIDELPDNYAKKYARSSPGELVACAVEWSDRAHYSKEFTELLAKFNAPELLVAKS